MTMQTDKFPTRLWPLTLLCWIILVLFGLGALALVERQRLLAELEDQTATLHATASQRADQHDAHLTSLSAVALAEERQGNGLFLEVGTTIMRFYPRIKGLYLVPLTGTQGGANAGVNLSHLSNDIKDAARRSTGKPVLISPPTLTDQYLMVKRSPNSLEARYAIALLIDNKSLLATNAPFWALPENTRRLSLREGSPMARAGDGTRTVVQKLSSATQPLELTTATQINFAVLLPFWRAMLVVATITLVLILCAVFLRQRWQAGLAVRQAALSDHEARLTHAARVNALGEMASGIAHELTQPLTAILSETQAARRMMDNDKAAQARPVLDDIVQQTQRASSILERLRSWTRPNASRATEIDLRESAANVRSLFANQVRPEHVSLEFSLPDEPVTVLADSVEMEQVLFNLIQNAIEATGKGKGAQQVEVTLTALQDSCRIAVTDTGPGIEPSIRDQIFAPFVTSRRDGTGLGLALSQRLVERAGGEIFLADTPSGAKFIVDLPLARAHAKDAE